MGVVVRHNLVLLNEGIDRIGSGPDAGPERGRRGFLWTAPAIGRIDHLAARAVRPAGGSVRHRTGKLALASHDGGSYRIHEARSRTSQERRQGRVLPSVPQKTASNQNRSSKKDPSDAKPSPPPILQRGASSNRLIASAPRRKKPYLFLFISIWGTEHPWMSGKQGRHNCTGREYGQTGEQRVGRSGVLGPGGSWHAFAQQVRTRFQGWCTQGARPFGGKRNPIPSR